MRSPISWRTGGTPWRNSGGLWHGASWNFLLWGAFHGAFLMLERSHGGKSLYTSAPRALRVLVTFVLMLFSWVLFRTADLPAAGRYLGQMFAAAEVQEGAELLRGVIYQPYYLLSFAVAGWVVWCCRDTWEFAAEPCWQKGVVTVGFFLFALALMTSQSYNPFIYFIF